MLLKLSVERRKNEKLVNDIAGDSFTFFEQLQNKVFGSPKYDIIIAEPDIFKGKSPGRIFANFEIRKKKILRAIGGCLG